jgi:uncharacterized protein YjbI with pentapeptide repeats
MSWPTVGIIAAALGLAAAALWGAWWFWWRLPKRHVDRLRLTIRDPKARADVEDNFRKTIGQLLGGAAVLIGAALAYLQFTQQQQTSQRQFIEQQQASRDLLISNQVAKGFEQLGSDKTVVRLGGIYALEGVMNNSEQYHQPVLEALSAFVRDGTRTETGDGPPATDIQAVLTVLGRRRAGGTATLDLTYTHIPKANLFSANLSGGYLNNADLSGAYLIKADLSGAYPRGANLSGAELSDANLRGADLTGAKLIGAKLNDACLRGADLTGANLTDANLINANLIKAFLINANLINANLSDAFLIDATLNDAYLAGATITQAQLDQACGTNVKLDPGLTIKPCTR